MIDPKRLLDNLKRLLRRLENDLRERADTLEDLKTALQREYAAAKSANRTGEAFEVWREGMLTQAAVAWLLACVFVRFLEDNGLTDTGSMVSSRAGHGGAGAGAAGARRGVWHRCESLC